MQKAFLAFATFVVIAGFVVLFLVGGRSRHKIELKTYFADAQGLHVGANVTLAGVNVGSVTSVRVRPELRDHPAEVNMRLATPYQLKIPRDAIVRPQTAGLLGDPFAEIDIHSASGSAIEDGGVLKGDSTPQMSLQDLVEKLTQNMRPRPCPSAEDALTDKTRSSGNSQRPRSR